MVIKDKNLHFYRQLRNLDAENYKVLLKNGRIFKRDKFKIALVEPRQKKFIVKGATDANDPQMEEHVKVKDGGNLRAYTPPQFVVLDVDNHGGEGVPPGYEAIGEMTGKAGGSLEATALTPGNGKHYYFEVPPEYQGKIPNTGKLCGGVIDVLYQKNGAMVPGSVIKDGVYRWADEQEPRPKYNRPATPEVFWPWVLSASTKSTATVDVLPEMLGVEGDGEVWPEGVRNATFSRSYYAIRSKYVEGKVSQEVFEKETAFLVDKGERSDYPRKEMAGVIASTDRRVDAEQAETAAITFTPDLMGFSKILEKENSGVRYNTALHTEEIKWGGEGDNEVWRVTGEGIAKGQWVPITEKVRVELEGYFNAKYKKRGAKGTLVGWSAGHTPAGSDKELAKLFVRTSLVAEQ